MPLELGLPKVVQGSARRTRAPTDQFTPLDDCEPTRLVAPKIFKHREEVAEIASRERAFGLDD